VRSFSGEPPPFQIGHWWPIWNCTCPKFCLIQEPFNFIPPPGSGSLTGLA
jgi:hypothetical protein